MHNVDHIEDEEHNKGQQKKNKDIPIFNQAVH